MSATHSTAESAVGLLTQSEVVFLRQQEQVAAYAAQRSHSGTAPERGRGPSRTSQHTSSSRAVSAASSHSISGRVILDPNNLHNLAVHLNYILASVEGRINQLTQAVDQSVERSRNQANQTMRGTQNEMERCRLLMSDLDRLEDDQQKILKIRDKLKTMRRNTDTLSERLDRSRPSGHSSAARSRR